MKLKKYTLLTVGVLTVSLSFSQIHVLNNGKTGLGITLPKEMLHVKGKALFTSSSSSPTSAALIRGGSLYSSYQSPDYTFWNDDQTGIFHPQGGQLGFSTTGKERMLINLKNVVFNSHSDWAPAAYINAQHTNAVGYNMKYFGIDKFFVHGTGYIYNQGQYIGSDINLKKEIKSLESETALNKVLKLRGVSYKYKVTKGAEPSFLNTQEQIGFIAQEVESIIPEVVLTTEKGIKAIAYQNMLALFSEAIQEQDNQIKLLNEKIKNLENNSYNGIEEKENIGYLIQNSPNPFKEETKIKYTIKETNYKTALIVVFDMTGAIIKKYDISEYNGSLTIKGDSFVPGMYVYTLIVDGKEIDTKRMIL